MESQTGDKRGTRTYAFARARSSLGLVVTAWVAAHLPLRVWPQAGRNLSSVRSKLSSDPVQGGRCERDGWDQMAG